MTPQELIERVRERCMNANIFRNPTAEEIRTLDLSDLLREVEGMVMVPLESTKEMIEAGAQRLVQCGEGENKWPESWDALHVSAARNEAERVWRSMWLVADKDSRAAIDAARAARKDTK